MTRRARVDRLAQIVGANWIMTATVEEISETGARLACVVPPPLQARLTVNLPMASADGRLDSCELPAQVVRFRDDQIGIAFTPLRRAQRKRLRRLLDTCEPYLGPY